MRVMQSARQLCIAAVATAFGAASHATEPSAVPPPLAQESADCVHPVYATDQLICADPELRRLDADLVASVVRVHRMSGWPASPLFEGQQAWFKRRSLCAFQKKHRDCVVLAYRTRIRELEALAVRPSGGVFLRCKGNPAQLMLFPGPQEGRIITDAAKTPLFVAFPAAATPWTPFVSYREPAKQLVFERINDRKPTACIVEGAGG